MTCVVVRSAEGLRQEVQARDHSFVVDEPADEGGANRGPSPYELLLAALGSCTAITVELYARRKGWPLEGVEVRLEHSRAHAGDCDTCPERDVMLERIDKHIELRGPLEEDQRARLIEIADRCPVQQTFLSRVSVLSAQSLEYVDERVVPRD